MSFSPSPAWMLDPQLERDTHSIGDLALCRVLMMNDANYPWLVLVPRRRGACEIIDLEDADRAQLMSEIAEVSRALKAITHCDKINVAALGNIVKQLHIHVIARTRSDPAWPNPVWGVVPAKAYQEAQAQQLLERLKQELVLTPE